MSIKKRYPFLTPQYLIPSIILFVLLASLFIGLTADIVSGEKQQNSFSRKWDGYLLFYELFYRLEYRIKRQFTPGPPDGGGCLLYFDYAGSSSENRFADILSWVERGNVLVMVGIDTPQEPIIKRQISSGSAASQSYNQSLAESGFSLNVKRIKTITAGKNARALGSCDGGSIIESVSYGDGEVLLIPDNRFFINRSLSGLDGARFINRLLSDYFPLNFYLYEHNKGTRVLKNPVLWLFNGNLAFLSVHLILLGVVFLFWMGKRFGRPVVIDYRQRVTLKRHFQAVGNLYRKSDAVNVAYDKLKNYYLSEIKQLLGLKQNVSEAEVLKRLNGYQLPVEISFTKYRDKHRIDEAGLLTFHHKMDRVLKLLSGDRLLKNKGEKNG